MFNKNEDNSSEQSDTPEAEIQQPDKLLMNDDILENTLSEVQEESAMPVKDHAWVQEEIRKTPVEPALAPPEEAFKEDCNQVF